MKIPIIISWCFRCLISTWGRNIREPHNIRQTQWYFIVSVQLIKTKYLWAGILFLLCSINFTEFDINSVEKLCGPTYSIKLASDSSTWAQLCSRASFHSGYYNYRAVLKTKLLKIIRHYLNLEQVSELIYFFYAQASCCLQASFTSSLDLFVPQVEQSGKCPSKTFLFFHFCQLSLVLTTFLGQDKNYWCLQNTNPLKYCRDPKASYSWFWWPELS